MKKQTNILVLIVLSVPSLVFAGAFDEENIYFGAGLGINSVSGSGDATGFQLLLGYPLKLKLGKKKAKTAIEVGYMNSGDFGTDTSGPFNKGSGKKKKDDDDDLIGNLPSVKNNSEFNESSTSKGLWMAVLTEYPLSRHTDVVGRFGMDIGDDSGFMFGIGLGFKYSRTVKLRGEYVVRDNIDSMQFNVIKDM